MITATDPESTRMLDADLFRTVAGYWPTGVAVITTVDADGRPYGLTANAVTSLSIKPLQYLICVDLRATSLPALLESRLFCLNFLADGQEDVAQIFASKKEYKFGEFGWSRLPNALPVIDGNVAHIGCEVVAVHDGGDHKIIVGGVTHIGITGGDPLVYFKGAFHRITQP